MASDEDARVRNAMSALQTWVSALPAANLPEVPEYLLMESGVIIASRRKVGLRTLSGAPRGYSKGGSITSRRDQPLVLSGLRHLAGDLQYAQFQHDDDIPTLRLLCVRLAQSMSKHGFADDPAVQQWLHEGKDDPFPEVRKAAMLLSRAKVTTKDLK